LLLQNHAEKEILRFGFKALYLRADLDGFYEKNGWAFLTNAYMVSGEKVKIYSKGTTTMVSED